MNSDLANEKINNLLEYLLANGSHLVIDGDTHPTDLSTLEGNIRDRFKETTDYYQGRPISPEQLIQSMDCSGVDMSLTWQNPAAFDYGEDESENFQRLLRANQDIARFAEKYPTRFIPAGWTDPKSLGVEYACKLAEICVQDLGFTIVKMNPAQNSFPIDSPMVKTVVDKIVQLGAASAFHFGGDSPFTPPSGFKKLLEQYPKHPFIGVHMGGGGSHYVDGDDTYIGARSLGIEHPNLFYVISAKRDCHLETDMVLYFEKGAPYAQNLGWGSDAPYGLQSWNLGGSKELINSLSKQVSMSRPVNDPKLYGGDNLSGYMGSNLARIVIKSAKNILAKNNITVS